MKTTTLAFDVYGTLIDTYGILSLLDGWLGADKALSVSQTWREKQLEYSFRRGLMDNYVDFGVCTRQALDYSAQFHDVELSSEQKETLMEAYKTLPAHPDTKPALEELQKLNIDLYAFSNGSAEAVEKLLEHAGIRQYFKGIVSCDPIKMFKPSPKAYTYFLEQAGSTVDTTWLISSNPFDVTGSISAGYRSAWVQRSTKTVFDPWEIQPTNIIPSLTELKSVIEKTLL